MAQVQDGAFWACVLAVAWSALCGWAWLTLGAVLMLVPAYLLLKSRLSGPMLPCAGRHVLITGCDTGFGNHLARRLDREGVVVYAGCLDAKGDNAKALKEAGSSRMRVLQLDVTSDEQVRACREEVEKAMGRTGLWAVVNNAGIMNVGEIEFCTMDMYRHIVEINLLGVIRVTKAFLPLIRKVKGRMVQVTSVRGLLAFPANSTYVSSKFAAEAFADVLRLEMQQFGVKVTIVEPGHFGAVTGLNLSPACAARMMKDVDQTTAAAAPDVISAYGKDRMAVLLRAWQNGAKSSHPSMQPVTDAILHALFAEFPRYRYLVDGTNGWIDMDCMLARLRPYVPTRLFDRLSLRYLNPLPPVSSQ